MKKKKLKDKNRKIQQICVSLLLIVMELSACGKGTEEIEQMEENATVYVETYGTDKSEQQDEVKPSDMESDADTKIGPPEESESEQDDELVKEVDAIEEAVPDTYDYSYFDKKVWVIDPEWDSDELEGGRFVGRPSLYMRIDSGIIRGEFSLGLCLPYCYDTADTCYYKNGNLEGYTSNGTGKCTFIDEYIGEGTVEIDFQTAEGIAVTVHWNETVSKNEEFQDKTYILRPYKLQDILNMYEGTEVVEEKIFQVHTDFWEEAYLIPMIYTYDDEPRVGQRMSELYLADGGGNVLLRLGNTIPTSEYQDIWEEDTNGDGRKDIVGIVYFPESSDIDPFMSDYEQTAEGVYVR